MYRYADNVVERSTDTTTGAYQLAGVPADAEPGARTFVAGIGDTNTCDYYAKEVNGTAWERGIGTVADAATDTLTRTVHTSSNSNNAVDWTGKTVEIIAVLPARRLATDHAGMVENLTLATSRSGNAETIAVKTLAGTDPSVTDPVRVGFAKTDGTFEVLELTSSLSLTISSGSTLGAVNGTPFRVWVVLFNDAGTLRLGAIKCALSDGVRGLQDNVLESSTAEGGAGAADSAGVIYTGTAVTSKAMRVLGCKEYTLTTAGTWATAPSLEQPYGPGVRLPGELVQEVFGQRSDRVNSASTIAADDTIPQSNEGVEIFALTMTPRSAANQLRVHAWGQGSVGAVTSAVLALFVDSETDARAASLCTTSHGAGYGFGVQLLHAMRSPGTSAITLKLRLGKTSGDVYLNGVNSTTRLFGGVGASSFRVQEIAT